MKLHSRCPTSSWLLTALVFAWTFALFSCAPTGTDTDDTDDTGDDTPPALQADSLETNDTWQQASPITRDTDVSATIHELSDVDFYRFTTAHGRDTYDKVRFSLSTTDTELLFHLEIYDTLGSKLLQITADTPGQALTYTLACPGGDYIFRVSGWDNIMGWDNGSAGEYTVVVTNLDANDAQAPNHTIDNAAEISFDQSYDGVIVSKHESEWFHVVNGDSTVWEQFTVQLTDLSAELAGYLAVYDNSQEAIYEPGGIGGNEEGADVTYSFTSKAAGFYFWVCGWSNIMHHTNGSKGSYTFTVIDNNANDSNEPDDTFADARTVASFPSGQISGTVLCDAANDNGGDYEFFKVSIPDGRKVQWSIDPAASNTELHFRVYDADQGYLGNQDGSDGETINGSMSNTSGTDTYFYISLGAFVGDNGDYSISFSETAAP